MEEEYVERCYFSMNIQNSLTVYEERITLMIKFFIWWITLRTMMNVRVVYGATIVTIGILAVGAAGQQQLQFQ